MIIRPRMYCVAISEFPELSYYPERRCFAFTGHFWYFNLCPLVCLFVSPVNTYATTSGFSHRPSIILALSLMETLIFFLCHCAVRERSVIAPSLFSTHCYTYIKYIARSPCIMGASIHSVGGPNVSTLEWFQVV